MRLDKFIAACGAASRSEVKKLVKAGRISIDGKTAVKSDEKVDENTAEIRLDGNRLVYREFVYLMLNKPSGYISATYDAKQPTVMQLLPEEYMHFKPFPVGRLDIDTEGLLLLTNDGKFAHELTNPKKHVYKTYYAELDTPMNDDDVRIFKNGIRLDEDFVTMPAELVITEDRKKVYIKICEGKFHQVKRMCASVGKNVVYLERVSMGGLELDRGLKRGAVRELFEGEAEKIFCDTKM